MTYIPRNSPCPCGSGKKHKRCCINKPQLTEEMIKKVFAALAKEQDEEARNRYKTFRKYNSAQVLKLLSLLQFQPYNQGKIVRLEAAVVETIKNINSDPTATDLSSLVVDIKANCKRNYAEDPPEEFFTENIVYDNGNNIVFPGISANGTEIVQGLINCLSQKDLLPDGYVKEVKEGILLILHIHNAIALSLGFTHRMFEEEMADEVFVPDEERIAKDMSLFSFTHDRIALLSKELGIAQGTFDQFVFSWQEKGLSFTHHDSNPLFQRPFILIDGEFILVMPTAELICLNDFILNVAKRHNCLDVVISLYAQFGFDELAPNFGRMSWERKQFLFSEVSKPRLFLLHESLWKIDSDKLVYVTFITEHPDYTIDTGKKDVFSSEYTARVENECIQIKRAYPESQILVLGVIHKSRVLGLFGLALGIFKNSEYYIFFSLLELQVITRVWPFDRLTLWKYVKYLSIAESKIHFAPVNTHYSKFNWYVRNAESFHDPDQEAFNSAGFGFEIEGDIRRKGVLKFDKIGIPFLIAGSISYIQCYRKEKYYPVYISQAVNYGILMSCLLKYSFPIWFMAAERPGATEELYINGILYWLNELHECINNYINQLGSTPVLFVLKTDKAFDSLTNLDVYDNRPAHIKYSLDKSNRRIDLLIPVEIIQFTSSPDNTGEQYLLTFIVDVLGELMQALGVSEKLPEHQVIEAIEKAIPTGNRKMIITATGERDLTIADIDIDDARIIPKSDRSFNFENQVGWLNYPTPIPSKIIDNDDKIKLFNDLVSLHFCMLESEIKQYDGFSLLLFLMRRHEALIQARSFRKVTYPVKHACYGKFYDVYKEFAETEGELNFSSLAARFLIEIVACLMPTGKLRISDDDADMLLAHAGHVIQYGSLSDEIRYVVRGIKVGLLPSGRIGIDRSTDKKAFTDFSDHVYGEEFHSYIENFAQSFRRRKEKGNQITSPDIYYEHVNNVFKNEWGIGLYDLPVISHFICYHLYGKAKSVHVFQEEELIATIKRETNFTQEEIASYIRQLSFLRRSEILKPPDGFDRSEIYPWRYNRRLSYLMKPIVPVRKDGNSFLVISARHLWMASENLVAAFGNGILKVDSQCKGIKQLIADQNLIKGKEYRDEVHEWLKRHTIARVIPHEVRISPRGFFRSPVDKGDIDILAIDDDRGVIYSIECKNTRQSKVAYDYRMELNNYLGIPPKKGLISKHVNRDIWLKDNKDLVFSKLKLEREYSICSLVVSKHILPTKFLTSVGIQIISFYELKKLGLPDS